jgi:sodium/bile acid cotransporter 7
LEIEQCIYAFTRFRFNAYVLLYNFGFVSAVVFGISRGLKSSGILSPIYSDGLVLCGALPLAVNAVSILTVACHGDEAVAIFNEAVSNMIGVFLSPLLIRGYLGAIAGANLPSTFWKLIVRVIVPLVIGQILRYFSTWVVEFRNRYKVWFTRAQKYLLVYIEYTLFCTTFKKNLGTGIGDAFTLVLVVFILQVFFLTIAWAISHYFYRDLPRLRVVGLFGPVAKTTSLGIPLILSLYQSNPRATIYTLPVLIWHPMLLVVGSILTPCLRSYVEREVERVEGKPVDAVESSEESDNGDEETPKEAGESEATKDKSG